VEKPDFVVIVPLNGNRLHLVEQFRYPVGARYWEPPDADPLELARGELQEETGLRAAKMIEVGHLFEAYGYSTQGYHIFLASDLSQAEADRPQEEQDLVSSAFTVAEVERMICEGVIKDGVTVAVFGLLRLKGLL
jgi:ADP-ribose pyrophosphatase